MIVVANKRKKVETLMKEYPGCIIIDVTSNSQDGDYVKFSPFYPHGGIPVPGMPGKTAARDLVWGRTHRSVRFSSPAFKTCS